MIIADEGEGRRGKGLGGMGGFLYLWGMKGFCFVIGAVVIAASSVMAAMAPGSDLRQNYSVYMDDAGVMRRNDTGAEVAYFGTNYTLPFAHPYRWMKRHGADSRSVIDNDVYHFKRLGMNGFRLHLWDVELTDSLGNLQDNEHLELLDYLLARLRENGIDVILTAQTNFGNGYPERNIDTGGYSYRYDKCEIHSRGEAQRAQENYLRQLAEHVNPLTGMSYAEDKGIIAMEINNEPCHEGASSAEVTGYINLMADALRAAGWEKPILYNVSHNPEVTGAYYDAKIDGTTYQWYPTGLVAGHLRKGNFLPETDRYEIPWRDSIGGYGNQARIVYEFDPGDVLVSYLYPAIARTMRGEGFQWLTQFAYDSTPMAAYNTDYQTHYLNLAYTPGKALGMLIASEVMQRVRRGERFGDYPQDTVFGDFRLSPALDLAEFTGEDKFYYTNTTTTKPRNIKKLNHLAGHGSSPVVSYEGTGAYFLDRLDKGLWRLEVMPDVVLTEDPFAKPSEMRKVGRILYSEQPMRICLPELGEKWYFRGINGGNTHAGQADKGSALITPGTYLLSSTLKGLSRPAEESWRTFAAPPADRDAFPAVVNESAGAVARGEELRVRAQVAWQEIPDSVVVYPGDVNFWRTDNHLYPLRRSSAYGWEGDIPAPEAGYNIVVYKDGKSWTFPDGQEGTPLDWDRETRDFYRPAVASRGEEIVLLNPSAAEASALDYAILPDGHGGNIRLEKRSPVSSDAFSFHADKGYESILRVFTGDFLEAHPFSAEAGKVVVKGYGNSGRAEVAINLSDGRTLTAPVTGEGPVEIPFSSFSPAERIVIPAPYPTFLSRRLPAIEGGATPRGDAIESIEVRVKDGGYSLEGIWLAGW